MTGLFEQVAKEMKSHPITLILVIAGWAAIVLGAANFARAAEVKVVEEKVDRVLELQLSTTLRNLHIQYCVANGNKIVIASLIDDYQIEYRDLTGSKYLLHKCEKKEG